MTITIESQDDEGVVSISTVPDDIDFETSIDEAGHTFESIEKNVIVVETFTDTIHTFEVSPPKGEKGEPGVNSGMVIEHFVAYPMSGHRIVVLNENEEAEYASSANPFHANKIIGMTIHAAINGEIGIQTGGELTEPSWNWTLDIPIWLGVDGLLTQVQPVSGFSLIIGFPITQTKMFIGIREPIFLI
jgi:hypothetical protein